MHRTAKRPRWDALKTMVDYGTNEMSCLFGGLNEKLFQSIKIVDNKNNNETSVI